MEKLNIICIDSGIREDHPLWKNENIPSYQFTNGQLIPSHFDKNGHGTAVFGILHTIIDIADVMMIKLFDDHLAVSEYKLIELLNYIEQNLDVNIINMSMGIEICENEAELQSICERFDRKGVILISAFDNGGAISFPAAFKSVIGVTNSILCRKSTDFCFYHDEVVNIGAKGNIQRLVWNQPDYLFLGGNSFACAHVAKQAALFMMEGIRGRKNILLAFSNIARKHYEYENKQSNEKPNYTIQKAVLFPFNKEMHAILSFSELLPFSLEDVYDNKYSAKVGAFISKFLKVPIKRDYEIKNINSIDWDSFDTIILGHLDELANYMQIEEFRKQLIDQALSHQKNIYSFDDLTECYPISPQLYYPRVSNQNLSPLRQGKLYRISKPVIGIFGTSSRQGKFTLQLKLRKKFLELGYQIGQIGTEPSSLLFEMDTVFPIGHNSSVYINDNSVIRYINSKMYELCKNEVIIVGSQSGTIPFDYGNLDQYCVNQQEFLLGVQPDILVLCVNPYDEIEYITRTKNYLESLIEGSIISIVVFPMTYENTWKGIYGNKIVLSQEEFALLKVRLEQFFDIPVYRLDDNELDEQLVLQMIHALSGDSV